MKKLAALCIALIGMVSLTSCMNANANVPDTEDKVTIEMKLDENYDDTDPFINERLFCVSEDLSRGQRYCQGEHIDGGGIAGRGDGKNQGLREAANLESDRICP